MRILHTLETDNFLYKNVDWETLPKQKIIPFWGPGLESEAHHKFRKRKLKKNNPLQLLFVYKAEKV